MKSKPPSCVPWLANTPYPNNFALPPFLVPPRKESQDCNLNQGDQMSDQNVQMETNDQLVLIAGLSAAGKSASLRNIRNQENWFYMNTEAG